MNVWECERPGCKTKALGIGGAIGLRAIGWYFMPGPVIYCPHHRPDGIQCVTDAENKDCGLCRAEVEVVKFQAILRGEAPAGPCSNCGKRAGDPSDAPGGDCVYILCSDCQG